jgi:hypothetical protein
MEGAIMSGGGGGGNNTTTAINYSPEEANQRATVMTAANNIFQNTVGPLSASKYPGAVPVAFSPETKAAQGLAVQNAAAAQDQINTLNQSVNYGLTGAMDVQNNPYLRKAMEAAIRTNTQNFTDSGGVLSHIRDQGVQAGQAGGSTRGDIAAGIAASRLNQTNADTVAQMGSNAYDKGQDTFTKTMMFAPQALEAGMTPVNWLSGVGAQKENLAAEQANYEGNSRMWALNAPWTPLQNYANIVFGGSSPGTTTESSMTAAKRDPLATATQAAGAGLTATSLYQMLQSI